MVIGTNESFFIAHHGREEKTYPKPDSEAEVDEAFAEVAAEQFLGLNDV